MASIVKRRNKYSVVYTCVDESGIKRQKWETFSTNADAKRRKSQIEYELSTGTFIAPTAKTVRELLEEYISIYGVSTWALSTYESRRSIIDHYVNPFIGDMKLDDVSPRVMDKYYKDLLTVKAIPRPYRPKDDCITARTVREIHKVLRNAFNQAVKWELMSRNPVLNATLPKCEAKTRDIWTAETLFKALELCEDDLLALALNLAFSASLRMGEMLGLTWNCVDVSPESINSGKASIYIDKELQRVSKQSLADLDNKDVQKIFPAILESKHTCLVLKSPKTKTSIRRVFLPKTVAGMLIARKKELDELKELFGEEYIDYDLVFCNSLGRPIEGQIINRALKKLIEEHDLPKVVFHSFRHSSITYKLKLNGGDMKSVQGDSGHAQVKMVADVYSHIIDEDRRHNAQRFEEAFYANNTNPQGRTEVAENVRTPDDKEMLLKLLDRPEVTAFLKSLAQA